MGKSTGSRVKGRSRVRRVATSGEQPRWGQYDIATALEEAAQHHAQELRAALDDVLARPGGPTFKTVASIKAARDALGSRAPARSVPKVLGAALAVRDAINALRTVGVDREQVASRCIVALALTDERFRALQTGEVLRVLDRYEPDPRTAARKGTHGIAGTLFDLAHPHGALDAVAPAHQPETERKRVVDRFGKALSRTRFTMATTGTRNIRR